MFTSWKSRTAAFAVAATMAIPVVGLAATPAGATTPCQYLDPDATVTNIADFSQQFTLIFTLPLAPGSIGLAAGDRLSIQPVSGATLTNANISINDTVVASASSGGVSYLVPSDVVGGQFVSTRFDVVAGPHQTFNISCEHVDTADALNELAADVVGVGSGSSLANKVAEASASLAANDIPSTCLTMQGFINAVNAQTGKKIAPTLAASLISDAQAIRTALGC